MLRTKGPDRIAAGAGAEVEHQPGVAGKAGRRAQARWNSSISRVLPMPASPRTCTVCPVPASRHACSAAWNWRTSALAADEGRRSGGCAAHRDETPGAHRPVEPFDADRADGFALPACRKARHGPSRRRGSRLLLAASVSREARFTLSPVTVYSRWLALPVSLATTWPQATPMWTRDRTSRRAPRASASRRGWRGRRAPRARRRCRERQGLRKPP